MRTDFLKKLGIEDQSVIDQILAENGRDINREKDKAGNLQSKIDELNQSLEEKDEELKDFDKYKTAAEQVDGLKQKITTLETEANEAKTKYESDVNSIHTEYALKAYLRDQGAKNVQMVLGMLDTSKISRDENGKLVGAEEQVKALKEGADTSFAFGDVGFKGVSPSNSGSTTEPARQNITLADAVRNFYSKN